MLYATKDNVELEERNVFGAMTFVSRGEELLKRTRKGKLVIHENHFDHIYEEAIKLSFGEYMVTGDLHWKQVSFNINSNWQVSYFYLRTISIKIDIKTFDVPHMLLIL